MKKKILLGTVGLAILFTLLVTTAKAQTFVASFGVEHTWRVPMVVSNYVNDVYYGYEWVHARRVMHHGTIDYEIVLQRGHVFVEVTIDTFGRIFRTVRRDAYPFNNHVCNTFCGYHSNYYNAYYSSCHSHHHHGHNHVVYNRPRGNAYGYYNNGNHNNGHHHGSKQNNRNYDRKDNGYDRYDKNDRDYSRKENTSYPSRRGTYQSEVGRNNRSRSSEGRSSNSSSQGRKTTTSSSTRYATR